MAIREYLSEKMSLMEDNKMEDNEIIIEPEIKELNIKKLTKEALNKKFESKPKNKKLNPYNGELANSKMGLY